MIKGELIDSQFNNQKGFALFPLVIWIAISVSFLLGSYFLIPVGYRQVAENLQANVDAQLSKQVDIMSHAPLLPSPTATSKAVQIPADARTKPTPSISDPIIDCVSDWQKEQGQSLKAKKSICDTWVDCKIGNKIIRGPKDTCDKYQKQLESLKSQQQPQVLTVNCQLKSGWIVLKKEDCIKAQNEWKKEINSQVSDDLAKKLLDIERRMWSAQTPEEFNRLQEELKHLSP